MFYKFLFVCYNGKVFDLVVFIRIVLKYFKSGLMIVVEGFVDMLFFFKEFLLNCIIYKFESFVSEIVNFLFEVYFVLEDVKVF